MPSSAARRFDLQDEPSPPRKPPMPESNPSPSTELARDNESSPRPIHSSPPPHRVPLDFPLSKQDQERLLNAREVAARLGVSERWVRDHTTRRSPKIRGVKLGTLMRYRRVDVEEFMERLTTSRSSVQPQFGG
jgi:excisionase family DNA binding protein